MELEQKLQRKFFSPSSLRNQLRDKKSVSILCYPKDDSQEAARRVRQLKRLGVKAIHFVGQKRVSNLSVLGKGCVGIVVVASTKTGQAALKIRRVDADRNGMQHEAEMLAKANVVGIGPRLLAMDRDFLLMEFINGSPLPGWVADVKGRGTRNRIRSVLRDILDQCHRLDHAGLDHGELSRAPKHIIIDMLDKPHIVDFETASIMRRTSNVTSICQYLFMKSQLAAILRRKLGDINREVLVAALRRYKHDPTRRNFEAILKVCRLVR